MYYLRRAAHTEVIPENGQVVEVDEMAVFKHHDCARFYRREFVSVDTKDNGLKVYTCKTLKPILKVRQSTFDYCGEWFDVYDENGIVHGEWESKENN